MLHAPGWRCTYEPQWGSDVFAMFESLVEGRVVPWSLLVKDMPVDKHQDLDFIVGQLDWDSKNVDPEFKRSCYRAGRCRVRGRLGRSLDRLRSH